MKEKLRRGGRGIKVLLVYPNPTMDNLIPIGVSLLSACLKEAGHDVKLFDTTFFDTGEKTGDEYREKSLQVIKTDLKGKGIVRRKVNILEEFKKEIENYKPDLIAATAIEASYSQALQLFNSIRNTKIPKILGGIYVTFRPEDVINNDAFDMICIGEGEDAIVELADRIGDGKDYSDTRNLWIKKNGQIIKNPLRPLKNLDDLPFQDWEIFDKKRMYKPMWGKIPKTLVIEGTRGCNFNCTFCCNPSFKELYKDIGVWRREKSIEKIVDEIAYFKERYGIELIKFTNANFLDMDDKRFDKFIRLYNRVKVHFWVATRPEKLTEEKIQKLEEVGLRGISMGLESGNDFIRNNVIKKGGTKDSYVRGFHILKKFKNLHIWVDNMIGFPYEERKHIFDTIETNRKINIPGPCLVNILGPYCGTEIRETCVKLGYMSNEQRVGDYRKDCILNMPQISRKELLGLQRAFPLYVKFPKSRWPEIRKAEQGDKVFAELSKEYSEKYLKK